MRYAVINTATNEIQNIIIWDGHSLIELPDGCNAVPCTEEHEAEWSAKFQAPEQSELNAEQELLLALLEKYGIPTK
jgi:hypothetical protein